METGWLASKKEFNFYTVWTSRVPEFRADLWSEVDDEEDKLCIIFASVFSA